MYAIYWFGIKNSSVKKSKVDNPKNMINTGLKKKLPSKLKGEKGMPQKTVIKKE